MKQLSLFDDIEEEKQPEDNEQIEAFNWAKEFPKLCDEEGNFEGFDVVMGNPPYISGRDFDENHEKTKQYYKTNYATAEYQLDLYQLFIEKAHQIAKKNAQISFIIPNTWLANHKTIKLRNFVLNNLSLSEIVYSKERIFNEADVDVIIFSATKDKSDNNLIVKKIKSKKIQPKHQIPFYSFKQNENQVFDIYVSEFDRLFPQIKVDEFKNLPIQTDESKEKNEIIRLVKKIRVLKLKSRDADISALTNTIDNLVYQIYELSDDEIKHIEQNYRMK